MKAVFADTAFYVAIHNRRVQLHARAESLTRLCSEFVFVEVANLLQAAWLKT